MNTTSLKHFFSRYHWHILIFILAAFLLSFRVTHVDLVSDDAIYTTRAIGMVDLAFANIQPTPLQWYDHFPWWAYLSWHDHPIVIFFIQHFFLSIRPNLWLVKLPFILMSLGTIFLTYFSTKKLLDERTALLTALLLALDTHFIALGRTSLMEAGVLFFIALTTALFLLYLEHPKYWWLFGLSCGIMLETKLTTVFMIPFLFTYLLMTDRKRFKDPHFIYAIMITVTLCVPLILYNALMYADRGHFALQFARLFHQTSPWIFAPAAPMTFSSVWEWVLSVGYNMSFPYLIIVVLAVVTSVFRRDRALLFPLLGVVWVTAEDLINDTKGLHSIFIAPIVAATLVYCYHRLQSRKNKQYLVIASILGGLYLLFFTVQSNVLPSPWGPSGWTHDLLGRRNYGGYQLNTYLDTLEKIVPDLSRYDEYLSLKVRKPSLMAYTFDGPNELNGRTKELKKIIIYDQNIIWNSQLWLFARRGFYTNLAIFSTRELPRTVRSYLAPETIYFIKADDGALLDPKVKQTTDAGDIEAPLIAAHLTPTLIPRDDGAVAYKVYTITDPAVIHAYGFADSPTP